MNPLETIQLAMTAILSNRLRSFLTVLGIVIGVFSVIILVALVSGLQQYITNQISSFGSNLIFVIPGKVGGNRGPGGTVVNRIELRDARNLERQLGDNIDVTPVIQKVSVTKNANKTNKDSLVYGVEALYPKIVTAIKIDQGRFFNNAESDAGKRVAIIGPSVIKNLYTSANVLGQTLLIGNARYEIIGILESRGSTFGADQDNAVYIPFAAMQQQFAINNLNGIYVSVPTADDIKPTEQKVTSILTKRLSEDDFTVSTQEQALSTISQITGVLTAALGGIAAISLIVGGIGVSNIMLVSVTERTREIGLRKALGAKPSDIRNQFLIEAVTLSALGGIIGIILGYIVSSIVNNYITTIVPLWSVGLSFGFSMLVGIVFGVAPAIRAAKLDPIQALRYE